MKNKLLSVWISASAIAMLIIFQSPIQALGQADAKEVLIPTDRVNLWNGEDFTGWISFRILKSRQRHLKSGAFRTGLFIVLAYLMGT